MQVLSIKAGFSPAFFMILTLSQIEQIFVYKQLQEFSVCIFMRHIYCL